MDAHFEQVWILHREREVDSRAEETEDFQKDEMLNQICLDLCYHVNPNISN